MKEFAVQVDGAPPPRASKQTHVIQITTTGSRPNLHFHYEELADILLRDVPVIAEDLLLLGTTVYAADARCPRGTAKDVFADQWYRDFRISLPMYRLDVWKKPEIQSALAETLKFVTGDHFQFEFHARSKPRTQQLQLPGQDIPPHVSQSDTVVLLSGGLDSLLATVAALDEGRWPLTVGHRPATQIHSRQNRVLRLLRERRPAWAFPHVGATITPVSGERPKEFSQRSRSFLFACLGAATCVQLDVNEMRLCDNGIVSLNLPQSGQNIGTMLSRSTHPGYLQRVQKFLRLALGTDISVINTLLNYTKKDVVEGICKRLGPEAIQETVSCARTEGRTRGHPHCGVCTQCIDRRFATTSAGVEEHDLEIKYEQDIFRCNLAAGDDRAHVENYVRFAQTLESLGDAEAFATKYIPEISEALPDDMAPQKFIEDLWDVFNRHQQGVNQVLDEIIRKCAPDIRKGALPEHSLPRLLARGEHNQDPRDTYIRQLGSLFQKSLPQAFDGGSPDNEAAMQKIGHAVLSAAGMSLRREFPLVPFAGIGVKPDFSDPENSLWVEFKLIRTRGRRSKITDEIAADLIKYEAPNILFVVYDPTHAIPDDEAFVADFEAKGAGRAFVTIVR